MKTRISFEKGSIEYKRMIELYNRMTDLKLLKRCEGHHTQNPNESLHSRIWKICPKNSNFDVDHMRFAVHQTILTYHLGYEMGNILKYFDIETTTSMKQIFHCQESMRTRKRPKKRRNHSKIKKECKRTKLSYNPGLGDDL